MKIIFFESKKPGKAEAPPACSVRPSGQVTLNIAAVKLLEAEAGEAATLGYDEDSKRWLIAHWPNGKAGQPELRATGSNAKGSLRFQCKAPAEALYAQLPIIERGRASVPCGIEAEPLTDASHEGACFYVLTLPTEWATVAAPGPKTASTTKEPGVGRGRYTRSTTKQKGALTRG